MPKFTFELEQPGEFGKVERFSVELPDDTLIETLPVEFAKIVEEEFKDEILDDEVYNFNMWSPAKMRLLKEDGSVSFEWELQPRWILTKR